MILHLTRLKEILFFEFLPPRKLSSKFFSMAHEPNLWFVHPITICKDLVQLQINIEIVNLY